MQNGTQDAAPGTEQNPTNNVAPTNGTEPVQAMGTVNYTQPGFDAVSANPMVPVNNALPVTTIEPVNSAGAAQAANTTEPTIVAQPVNTTVLPNPAEPTIVAQPLNTTEPALAASSDTTVPTNADDLIKFIEPINPVEPGTTTDPAQDSTTPKAAKGAKAAKTPKTKEPAKKKEPKKRAPKRSAPDSDQELLGLGPDSDSSDSDDDVKKRRELAMDNSGPMEEDDATSGQWTWERADNIPQISPFIGTPGLTNFARETLGEKPNVLAIFYEIFGNDFWEMIAAETNKYAEKCLKSEGEKKMRYNNKWTATTPDEIKAYIALSIIMSQVKKPTIQMNWTKRKVIETPVFGKTMSYARFLLISRFLHFADEDEEIEKSDQLYNLRNVINYFNDKFGKLYQPEEDVLIEESLVKIRDRLNYSEIVPATKDRFGIKIYKLTETKSRFCSDFKVSLVIDKETSVDNTPESVVLDLAKSLQDKGHTLFLDYWYSSPQIFLNLQQMKINAVGYVRASRKNMPKNLWFAKLEEGEHEKRSCLGILAFKWKHKKEVCMLSTKHAKVKMVETGKKEKVLKPSCAIEYEKGQGDPESADQFLTCFPIMRKFMKGYRKIFFYMTDLAFFNAFIIYDRFHKSKKKSYGEFLLDLSESLLETAELPEIRTAGRPAHGETLARLQAKSWGHFPRHIPPTNKKSNPTRTCKVCSKRKKRSETSWECKQCLVSLHVPECFEKYHTIQDY